MSYYCCCLWISQCDVTTPQPLPHSPISCDVVSSNQSGILKHNTLTLGMLCQGGGHFSLYNNTKHEPPAGRWLPLPPPPSANAVSIAISTTHIYLYHGSWCSLEKQHQIWLVFLHRVCNSVKIALSVSVAVIDHIKCIHSCIRAPLYLTP